MVLTTGFEAMKSGDSIDYQRFYQQQSDVCMLRLFDSFAESAPQLVFHLYIMILKSQWPIEQVSSKPSARSLVWTINFDQTVKLGFNEQIRDRPNLFAITGVCYNRVDLCSKMINWDWKNVFVITECSL